MRLTAFVSLSLTALATAVPYGITSRTEAKSVLAQLKVAPSGSAAGYSLGQFGSVQMRTDKCDTEEIIVRWRDASTNAQVDDKCTLAIGTWNSPWDGVTWPSSQADKISVERLITPLNAWIVSIAS